MYRDIASAYLETRQKIDSNAHDIEALKQSFGQLVKILIGRGALEQGHERFLGRSLRQSHEPLIPAIRLSRHKDKYSLPNSEVDCASRIHACRARCCSFAVELSRQDLDERVLRWEIESPYLLRQESDGYCTYMDRGSCGCTTYESRPAPCRIYDCRDDQRIWLDFDNMIPSPRDSADITET